MLPVQPKAVGESRVRYTHLLVRVGECEALHVAGPAEGGGRVPGTVHSPSGARWRVRGAPCCRSSRRRWESPGYGTLTFWCALESARRSMLPVQPKAVGESRVRYTHLLVRVGECEALHVAGPAEGGGRVPGTVHSPSGARWRVRGAPCCRSSRRRWESPGYGTLTFWCALESARRSMLPVQPKAVGESRVRYTHLLVRVGECEALHVAGPAEGGGRVPGTVHSPSGARWRVRGAPCCRSSRRRWESPGYGTLTFWCALESARRSMLPVQPKAVGESRVRYTHLLVRVGECEALHVAGPAEGGGRVPGTVHSPSGARWRVRGAPCCRSSRRRWESPGYGTLTFWCALESARRSMLPVQPKAVGESRVRYTHLLVRVGECEALHVAGPAEGGGRVPGTVHSPSGARWRVRGAPCCRSSRRRWRRGRRASATSAATRCSA
ncbi:unnamed protein product [Arctia plantaginis]|uniref:Uncharacterized protein n=1 Tax=Arctia plantaginis TaxID=874455 RepID=A0A8S1ABF5_ARCPL|nr:unnamed protein product [Arctia plantaginis]